MDVHPDLLKASCVRHGVIEHGDVCPLCILANGAMAEVVEPEDIDRPEDCERDCFRHGGPESCVCEEGDDGTWQPGC